MSACRAPLPAIESMIARTQIRVIEKDLRSLCEVLVGLQGVPVDEQAKADWVLDLGAIIGPLEALLRAQGVEGTDKCLARFGTWVQ